jgi:hypothetical protein
MEEGGKKMRETGWERQNLRNKETERKPKLYNAQQRYNKHV